jgi:peroxiredoxin
MTNIYELPANLPVPQDDGGASHLVGSPLPDLVLNSTSGKGVNLSRLAGTLVLYCYPMTGQPNVALPAGWDDIPGARGCTPQTCAYRDLHHDMQNLGARIFGISTQDGAYQLEMAQRLHLPFEILSDAALHFAQALKLPLMEVAGMTLMKRVTMIVRDGVIVKTHYPIFPTHEDAPRVLKWLIDQP